MIEVRNVGNTDRLAAWLEKTCRPSLKADVSKYAPGRLKVWLGTEPTLTSPTRLLQGLPVEDKLISRLQEIVEFQFDFALVTYSGDKTALGIEPHRDAGFAGYEAYSLNVSGECLFRYWNGRESFGAISDTHGYTAQDPPTHVVTLKEGDLAHFNCKNIHAATPSQRRWNINFWKKK